MRLTWRVSQQKLVGAQSSVCLLPPYLCLCLCLWQRAILSWHFLLPNSKQFVLAVYVRTKLTCTNLGNVLDNTPQDLNRFFWVLLGSLEYTWVHLGSLVPTWEKLALVWFTWVHLSSLWFALVHLGSLGFTWVYLGYLGFTLVHLS